MKGLLAILVMVLIPPLLSFGQDSLGYWVSNSNGDFTRMDLSDASKTFIGITLSDFTGGDFGTNNVLYALHSLNDGFYKIDTATGLATLIGTHPPPGSHIWMGLAYDDSTGIMYGLSAMGTLGGKSSIYTIDESNGSYTLIGSQGIAYSLVCIALDENGQMYGLNDGSNAKIYKIDKTDGSVTELGSIGQNASGFGHAMDFDPETKTMYLATYNSSSAQNTLRIVDLKDGNTTEVGDVGTLSGIFAVAPASTLSSDFSANDSTPCEGNAVQFTDLSVDATSWSWVFEGGLPPSSNYQNPTVIYRTPGIYDVELTVSDSSGASRTELKEDFITVLENPSPQIIGDSMACNNDVVGYSAEGDSASTFLWGITGGGIITDDSSSHVTVLWGEVGNGTIDVTEITLDSCTNDAETLEITIDECVGVEENTARNLSIYPNPVTDVLYLESESTIKSIAVFGFTGNLLTRVKTDCSNCQLNTSGYKPGIYLLEIETGSTTIRKRVVIK